MARRPDSVPTDATLASTLYYLRRPTSSYETGKLGFPGPDAEPNTLASDPSMIGQPSTIAYGVPASESAHPPTSTMPPL